MKYIIKLLKSYFFGHIYLPVLAWFGLARRVEGISGVKEMLTIPEAAKELKISESTFRKLVAKRWRKIPFCKLGKRIVFKKDLLEKWIEDMIEAGVDV